VAAAEIIVVPVTTKAERETFVDLSYRLNGSDPNWVPPLRMEALELVTPGRNPFFEHADVQLFLAKRGGKVVGRISAHIDRLATAGLTQDELERAKKLDPKDPTPWIYSAIENKQDSRINEAVRDLERSLELNDNRRVYRSQFLLDQDRAVRSAQLGHVSSASMRTRCSSSRTRSRSRTTRTTTAPATRKA